LVDNRCTFDLIMGTMAIERFERRTNALKKPKNANKLSKYRLGNVKFIFCCSYLE